jgi:hypothetical protein
MTMLWSCPDPDCPPTEIGPAEVAAQPDVMSQLTQLGDLPDAEVLTPEEFEAKKSGASSNMLLSRLSLDPRLFGGD